MLFKMNDYKYTCNICKTNNFKSIEYETTDEDTEYIKDINNNYHYHDSNEGDVLLLCENNHEILTIYIASCTCGWNSKDKFTYCKESFYDF
jgi:hypothetical protein